MAYAKAIMMTLHGSRPVTRTIGTTSRTDTFCRVDIQADSLSEGDELPSTGYLIDGLDDEAIVDAGSTCRVLDPCGVWRMGQDGNWYECSSKG